MKGSLYIIATPIGNIEDITDRAKRILSEADIVAAEDTRTAQRLFNILGIKNKVISNHKFNEKHQVEFLISELEDGKNVALVSDAGTPCISDPGGVVVKAAAERGIDVIGVCGASSVITALSISGLCFGSFAFYGFLPKEINEIKRVINIARKNSTTTSVFFESPKRIKKALKIFMDETPDAELCLCNDMTKMFERIYRGNPAKILDELNSNPSAEKGEYTLVADLGSVQETTVDSRQTYEAMLIDHVVRNGSSMKEAVNELAKMHKRNAAKKDFYSAALNLKKIFSLNTGEETEND